MKKNQGITLLALIITIIIMLILAGVTISIVGGSDGIIAKAEKAVSETDKAAMQEDAELAVAAIKMDYYEDYAANRAKYANAKAFIVAELQKGDYKTSRGAVMAADTEGNITYTFDEITTAVTIDDNGKVTLGESSDGETITPEPSDDYSYLFDFDASTGTILGIKEEYIGKPDGQDDLPDLEIYYYVDDEWGEYFDGVGWCILNQSIDTLVVPSKIDGVAVKTVKNIGVINVPKVVIEEGIENVEKAYLIYDSGIEDSYNLIEEITMPTTVTNIGKYAFWGCETLKSITIPGVKTIDEGAFKACSSLSNISMPNVTSIESFVFSECTNLSSVNMPSVTSIGSSAFNSCTSLSSVNMPSVTTINGGAFNTTLWYDNQPNGVVYAGKVLYKYKGTMPSNTDITINAGTTMIGSGAFRDCTGLSNINIPDSVTSIGDFAFDGCTGLSSIDIPDSVTTMGYLAFSNWTASQTINCEILEKDKPSTWDLKWDYYNYNTARKAQLNWGVSM